tara:strand:- start:232 stop:654 length:423 start_codon:yes stop_codon:yes gene_type:complete
MTATSAVSVSKPSDTDMIAVVEFAFLILKETLRCLCFCVAIAPVLDPQYRKRLLKRLSDSELTTDLRRAIKFTPPSIRRIHDNIDSETLVISGENDSQVPLSMFDNYTIPHFIVLPRADHSITKEFHSVTMNAVKKTIIM